MRTSLEAFGIVAGGRRDGARSLADTAIERCLTAARLTATEVDLLVNCGIYREDDLGEPALAAMIQEDVAANPGHPPIGGHGTFSFDVAAGACGPMAAMQIVDGLIASGVVRHGVVVASDAHPGGRFHDEPPFHPGGAAVLLSATPSPGGFARFATALFPQHADDVHAEVRWEPRARRVPFGPRGRNRLVLERRDDHVAHAVACAVEFLRRPLDEQGTGLDDVAVLVTPHAGGIGPKLAAELGRPAVVGGEHHHTAGVLVALEEAQREGRLASGPALVVTVSAGLHVSCAVYRG